MKDGILKYMAKGAVGGVLVGVPAFGGQVVSGLAKAMSSTAAGLPNAVVDGVGATVVAVGEILFVRLVFGGKTMWKAVPLALMGVGIGTLLVPLDGVVDAFVRQVVGAPAAGAVATSSPAKQLAAANGNPGGVPRAQGQGNTIPGGRPTNQSLGGVMPGGMEGVQSTRSYGGTI